MKARRKQVPSASSIPEVRREPQHYHGLHFIPPRGKYIFSKQFLEGMQGTKLPQNT